MNKISRWILVAITLGVLSACAGLSTTENESTAVEPVSVPPTIAD